MLTVFIHECHRVFRDRLVDEEDEQVFDKLLVKNFV